MKQNYTIARGALDGVEAFLRVAERQSFRQAADDLGVSPSAVSQSIRALEARTGVALFTRTTRSVGLTEAGARFRAHAQPAFEAMVAASEAAKGLAERPSGLLRLAVPRAVVPLILEPILASFCAAYPEVTIEIAASEELIDLARDGFDAGVRMGQFIAEDMVTVRLSPPFRFMFVASPAYLARLGIPPHPDALRDHACIRIRRSSGALGDWRVIDDGRPVEMAVSGPMVANDFPDGPRRRAGRSRVGAGSGAHRAGTPRNGSTERGAAELCAKNPGRVLILLRAPPSPAEAARFHRSRESQSCSGCGAARLTTMNDEPAPDGV